METSHALIHFVGILAFMTAPQSETTRAARPQLARTQFVPPRVVAVLPRIERVEHANPGMAQTARVKNPSQPAPIDWLAGVENHAAILAFKETDEPVVTGWTKNHLWTSPDGEEWSYIKLNGERITFQTGAYNPPTSMANLALPHITEALDTPNRALVAGYKPPAYSLAAAVIEIPGGALRPCASAADGVNGRIDTEVTLATSGPLKISGGSGKSLTLLGNATLFIGNLPLSYGMHTANDHYSLDHYKAYCAMVSGATRCNLKEVEASIPVCGENQMRLPNGVDPPRTISPPTPMNLATFECSNSQWP